MYNVLIIKYLKFDKKICTSKTYATKHHDCKAGDIFILRELSCSKKKKNIFNYFEKYIKK